MEPGPPFAVFSNIPAFNRPAAKTRKRLKKAGIQVNQIRNRNKGNLKNFICPVLYILAGSNTFMRKIINSEQNEGIFLVLRNKIWQHKAQFSCGRNQKVRVITTFSRDKIFDFIFEKVSKNTNTVPILDQLFGALTLVHNLHPRRDFTIEGQFLDEADLSWIDTHKKLLNYVQPATPFQGGNEGSPKNYAPKCEGNFFGKRCSTR